MAIGRNIIITALPMLGTLASVILTLFVILGGVRDSSPLGQLYFFKLDLTGITTRAIIGDSGSPEVSTLVDAALRTALNAAGVSDFYTAALWGFCQGSQDKDGATTVQKCSKPEAMFWLDTQTLLNEELKGSGFKINLPASVTDYNGTIEACSKAMFVLYFISICVLFIAFVAGFFSYRSRGASCCAGIITFVGLIASVLASGIATGMYTVIRNVVNDNVEEYGIQASLGTTMYGLTWGATAAALWAFIWWLLTICCGSTRKKSVEPEKQPFIGYVPTRH